jgi:hypothetical protein
VTAATSRPTSDQHKQTPSDVRSNEHAKPTGLIVQPRQPIVLAEVTCHACGKKGHYRGSKECPKTPSSARIHALGLENEPGEETPHDDCIEEEEIPFEGPEFDGDANLELVIYESDDNIGSGAIVANFHIASESGNEVDIVQMAQLATTGETERNQKITNELVSSIKEQYEARGSGIKKPFRGPSAKQLKASEQQMWALNANLKPNMAKGPHPKVQIGRCPTAVLKVNGVEAFVCFDSGSELDAISPDFIRAIGIKPIAKDTSVKICLATKGSTSMTSYEVEVNLNLGDATMDHPLEILNLDRWDMILGSYFCEHYNVHIDYENKTIRISETTINALLKDEEASTRKTMYGARKSPSEPQMSAVTADD